MTTGPATGVPAGTWTVRTDDDAVVRLRSASVGFVRIDVTAPVLDGALLLDDRCARLHLRLAVDRLRGGNFVLQAAARRLVGSNDARVLTFDGSGPIGPPIRVSGNAVAGSIDLDLGLEITPNGPAAKPFAEIAVTGSADLGTIHLPLPGLGTIEDFTFDVDAWLALQATSRG